MEVHPEVGKTFIHVIPDNWGPFVDVRACWKSLGRRRPWTHVISVSELKDRQDSAMWQDPTVVFISWLLLDPGPQERRRCKFGCVYVEAMDEDGAKLLPAHLAEWNSFRDMAHRLDFVFTHTPWMKSMIERVGVPTFVMPAGWDPEAMGIPRWDTPKHAEIAYYGSTVGRREVIIPFITKVYAEANQRFINVCGSFGRGLIGQLDTSAASLYIAHSDVRSFSTWRLWQTASTSAALIAEPGDAWPFEAGKHFLEIPKFTVENMHEMAKHVMYLAKQRDQTLKVANEAHELARRFTVDRVEDDFIVPAAKVF